LVSELSPGEVTALLADSGGQKEVAAGKYGQEIVMWRGHWCA